MCHNIHTRTYVPNKSELLKRLFNTLGLRVVGQIFSSGPQLCRAVQWAVSALKSRFDGRIKCCSTFHSLMESASTERNSSTLNWEKERGSCPRGIELCVKEIVGKEDLSPLLVLSIGNWSVLVGHSVYGINIQKSARLAINSTCLADSQHQQEPKQHWVEQLLLHLIPCVVSFTEASISACIL